MQAYKSRIEPVKTAKKAKNTKLYVIMALLSGILVMPGFVLAQNYTYPNQYQTNQVTTGPLIRAVAVYRNDYQNVDNYYSRQHGQPAWGNSSSDDYNYRTTYSPSYGYSNYNLPSRQHGAPAW